MKMLSGFLLAFVLLFPFCGKTAHADDDFQVRADIQDAKTEVQGKALEVRGIEGDLSQIKRSIAVKNRELRGAENAYLSVRQKIGKKDYKKLQDESLLTNEEKAELTAAKDKIDSLRNEVHDLEADRDGAAERLKDAKKELKESKANLAKLERKNRVRQEEGSDPDVNSDESGYSPK